jgi:hypothetical protein
MATIAVATRARRLGMTAEQGVICKRVIEPDPAETHKRKAASVMVAMADLACLGSRVRFPVKTQPAADISVNALVARKAFAVLCLTRKGLVTGSTIRLQSSVGIAQRPRRDEPFHNALGRTRRRGQRQAQYGKKA